MKINKLINLTLAGALVISLLTGCSKIIACLIQIRI